MRAIQLLACLAVGHALYHSGTYNDVTLIINHCIKLLCGQAEQIAYLVR